MDWRQKLKFIGHLVIRHSIWIGIIILGWIGLVRYFKEVAWQFLFALIASIFAEAVALGLSNLALYVYTNISFTKGIFYGEDNRLNSFERSNLVKVIGQIFIGVHVLIAIVITMLFWAKIE